MKERNELIKVVIVSDKINRDLFKKKALELSSAESISEKNSWAKYIIENKYIINDINLAILEDTLFSENEDEIAASRNDNAMLNECQVVIFIGNTPEQRKHIELSKNKNYISIEFDPAHETPLECLHQIDDLLECSHRIENLIKPRKDTDVSFSFFQNNVFNPYNYFFGEEENEEDGNYHRIQ